MAATRDKKGVDCQIDRGINSKLLVMQPRMTAKESTELTKIEIVHHCCAGVALFSLEENEQSVKLESVSSVKCREIKLF